MTAAGRSARAPRTTTIIIAVAASLIASAAAFQADRSVLLRNSAKTHDEFSSSSLGVVTDPSSFVSASSSTASPSAPSPQPKSPLSMTVEELSTHLGGRGRALAAWDLYRIGVDPLRYYNLALPESEIDAAVYQVIKDVAGPRFDDLLSKDGDSNGSSYREEIVARLPAKRRTEGLGKDALHRLASLHDGGSNVSEDGNSSSNIVNSGMGSNRGGIEEAIGKLSHISSSSDGTTKLLIRMMDGLEVETVIIPWYDREKPKSTLCVSSQVGCKQGCTFCATGRMGRLRSLSSDEILCQKWWAAKVCRILEIPEIDNIVFMGMGEPADNADAVLVATEALADRQRYGLAQSRITVSTVAPDPDAFMALGKAPAALAWSVHASRDELRKQLVPTTKYTMEELRLGFVEALKARSKKLRTTMLEIALIDGVNDGVVEADHLADFAQQIVADVPGAKVVVNLIPYNSIDHPTYRKPSNEAVSAFQKRLMEKCVMVYVRTTRGDDESAACGQLATKKKKKVSSKAD